MQKKFGQILKNWKFSISIGRATDSIDRKSRKTDFWKIEHFNVETPPSIMFHEWNA